MSNVFLKNIRQFGLADGMAYNLSQILARLHIGGLYKYYFYAQPLTDTPRLPKNLGKKISSRWLQRGDPALAQIPRPAAAIEQRYEQNAECLAAFKGDTLVGCIWYVFDRYVEDEVRCDFILNDSQQCIWDFDVYVHPKHRIGIVFMHMWDRVNAGLRERGYRWSLSRISAFSLNSIGSHEKMGAERLSAASYLVLGPIQIMFSGGLPRLSLHAAQRPQLSFSAPKNQP